MAGKAPHRLDDDGYYEVVIAGGDERRRLNGAAGRGAFKTIVGGDKRGSEDGQVWAGQSQGGAAETPVNKASRPIVGLWSVILLAIVPLRCG